MDKKTYIQNLNALMHYLTEKGESGDLVASSGKTKAFEEIPIYYASGQITLLFERGSLYLQGFRNKDKQLFTFKGVKYAINPAKKFNIGTDYGDLGLDRKSPIYLSLNELSNAMLTLDNTKTNDKEDKVKKPMWQCAVGLSEALRFQDVAMAVMQGSEIPSLDWSARTKQNDFRVRVKHQ